jgi:hypothetical protein
MSAPQSHCAPSRAGAPPGLLNPGPGYGHDFHPRDGTPLDRAAVDSLSRLSLTSGSRTFILDNPNPTLFFRSQDSMHGANRSAGDSDPLFNSLQDLDNLFVEQNNRVEPRRSLRDALRECGFAIGYAVCHGFDEHVHRFQRYAVYQVPHFTDEISCVKRPYSIPQPPPPEAGPRWRSPRSRRIHRAVLQAGK